MKNKLYRYYELRNLAWQVLIECKITELPIDLNKIANHYGMTIQPFKFDNAELRGGHTNDNKILLYSIESNEQQARFTIAHEIGHVLLKHNEFSGQIEKEANSFAARLLMPVGVLYELGIYEAEYIAKICNVSIEAATFRAERMQILIQREKFGVSELEKQILNNFAQFIQEHKKYGEL